MDFKKIKKEVQNTKFTLEECKTHYNDLIDLIDLFSDYCDVLEAREDVKNGNTFTMEEVFCDENTKERSCLKSDIRIMVSYILGVEAGNDDEIVDSYTDTFVAIFERYKTDNE